MCVCVCVCVPNQTLSCSIRTMVTDTSAGLLVHSPFSVNEASTDRKLSINALLPTELQGGTMECSFVHYGLVLHLSGWSFTSFHHCTYCPGPDEEVSVFLAGHRKIHNLPCFSPELIF